MASDAIEELLGQADLRMTRRAYAHLSEATLFKAVLEARVIVSARRFRELHVGAENSEITGLKQIEVIPRMIQAEELLPRPLIGEDPHDSANGHGSSGCEL